MFEKIKTGNEEGNFINNYNIQNEINTGNSNINNNRIRIKLERNEELNENNIDMNE